MTMDEIKIYFTPETIHTHLKKKILVIVWNDFSILHIL